MAEVLQFSMLKNYPAERRYTILKPLHTSIVDSIMDMLVGRKI